MNAPVEQLTRSFQERQDGGDCTHLIKTNFKVAYLAVHLGSPFRQSILVVRGLAKCTDPKICPKQNGKICILQIDISVVCEIMVLELKNNTVLDLKF